MSDQLKTTFHRRELKTPAVAFSDPLLGRSYFQEALTSGHCEGFFSLSEHFQSQSHYAFCGISSLSMALNTLLIDPGRVYSGVWRWFDDSMLNCCEPLDIVRQKGIVLAKLACLARCNGATVDLCYASQIKYDRFKQDLIACTSTTCGKMRPIMIASYSRPVFNQTGSGHFSPIGAYAPESEMVLIMDVARFKYPPHWVPLRLLWESINSIDADADAGGNSRGYLLLTAGDQIRSEFEKLCLCPGFEGECAVKDGDGDGDGCRDDVGGGDDGGDGGGGGGDSHKLEGDSIGKDEGAVGSVVTRLQALVNHSCSDCSGGCCGSGRGSAVGVKAMASV